MKESRGREPLKEELVATNRRDDQTQNSECDSVETSRTQLSSEDERLIQLLEHSASLPEHVRELLIQRILTPEDERVGQRSADETQTLLNRILGARPSSLIESVTQRVDHYRTERVEQVKTELRKLVDRVDLQGEVQRLLSQLSIDVTLSIRLVPKEGATLGMTPKVETKAKLNIRSTTPENTTEKNSESGS